MAITRLNAQARILEVFSDYKAKATDDEALITALTDGKLYELFALCRLVEELAKRGLRLEFVGTAIEFKAAPGLIHPSDGHFEVFLPGEELPTFKIFVDIEVRTLGSWETSATDNSRHHEIDIAVVDADAEGRPYHSQLALGVECKAVANFTKSIVREVLGLRRELSLLAKSQPSRLSDALGQVSPQVRANPPSELWLVYSDPHGDNYAQSPGYFGVEFRHWEP